ncbi:MAG: hypothetical protein DMF93_15875 [Acidobacteria bacterium]|nr:MAG: hypothetical protein DMF93_15875 [Acidobacteriota bacterium]
MTTSDPIAAWHDLLQAERGHELCAEITASQRARRLRFGDRVLCPFLRPFFLTGDDEARVTRVAELLWTLGERVARAALDRPELLRDLALSDDEIRLARIDPGYGTATTAGRADAFILPDSLQFAEYNAESPAGPAYSEGLAELFAELPVMRRFRERYDVRLYRPIGAVLDALVASYHEWGGRAAPPRMAIVDWREVPTYSEFELLRDAFTAAGVPTIVCDPRDLQYSSSGLHAGGARIDLVYRRVLINDMVARPDECRALLQAYEARAVCVANTLRCKMAHKKAFFARSAAVLAGEPRALRDQTKRRVRRHRRDARLGDERRRLGPRARSRARGARARLGGAGKDCRAPRAVSRLRRRRRGDARHAGRFRAVRLSRPPRRFSDASERDGPRQRDVRRGTGARVRRRGN